MHKDARYISDFKLMHSSTFEDDCFSIYYFFFKPPSLQQWKLSPLNLAVRFWSTDLYLLFESVQPGLGEEKKKSTSISPGPEKHAQWFTGAWLKISDARGLWLYLLLFFLTCYMGLWRSNLRHREEDKKNSNNSTLNIYFIQLLANAILIYILCFCCILSEQNPSVMSKTTVW